MQLKYSSSKIIGKNLGQYRKSNNLQYVIIHHLSGPVHVRLTEFYSIFYMALNLQFIKQKYWQLYKIKQQHFLPETQHYSKQEQLFLYLLLLTS